MIGNPVGLVTTTTPRTTVAPAWSWSDGGAAGESGENLQPSLKTDATAAAASSPSPTSPATTTTQETTTKLLSSWYQDLFADLLAANSKTTKATPRPRPSTAPPAPPPPALVTAEAAIEISVEDGEESEHHDHQDHHHGHHLDEDHFEQLAQAKKSLPPAPAGNLGLSVTNSDLDAATRNFVDINNEVGLRVFRSLAAASPEDNLVFCPVSAASALAMIFLGARGATSWEINELLELDKMVSFNPHLLYKNISDTLTFQTDNFRSTSSKHILLSKVALYQIFKISIK